MKFPESGFSARTMFHQFHNRSARYTLLALLLAGLGAANTQAAERTGDLAALLDSDDTAAQTRWAQRYEHGEGVTRNFDYAVRLYCHAARAGHRDAGYRLGWMYANGRGVARDEHRAAGWFQLAAANGDEHALRMLKRLPRPAGEAQCMRPNGVLIERPLRSESDPPRAMIVKWVRTLAPRYKLDPALVLAVIRAESNFNPQAKSPKNAQGLMQLIPATAKRFAVSDAWDPLQNIRGGMAYLRWLLDHFDGDEALALAGYNAGENAVRRYKGIPPYPETRSYVKRVSRWRQQPVSLRPAPKTDKPA